MDHSIAKRGYLEGYLRSVGQNMKWQKRYYVLYNSSTQCQPRLDYYPDEASFQADKAVRKTIYVEEIKSVVHKQEEGRPNCLFISTDSHKDHVLSASKHSEAMEWLRAINEVKDKLSRVSDMLSLGADDDDDDIIDENIAYETLTKCMTFEVIVQQTEAADRCNISEKSFNLVIAQQHMALIASHDNSIMYSWQYSHIRRYGRNKLTFLFEAGRKCPSGPGMFILKTKEGQKIFQEIRGLTRNMRQGTKDDIGHNDHRPAPKQNLLNEPTYAEPEVPKRGYRATNSYKQFLPPAKPTVAPPPSRHMNIPVVLAHEIESKFSEGKKPTPPIKPKPGLNSSGLVASLGKVHLVNDQPTDAYTSVYEAKRLDPNYSTADHTAPKQPQSPEEPDYALYDVTASSRYTGGATAAVADPGKSGKPTPSFLAALRSKPKVSGPVSPPDMEDYAHLNISATPFAGNQRQLPQLPQENEYELAGSFDQSHRNNSSDHLYDEVGNRG